MSSYGDGSALRVVRTRAEWDSKLPEEMAGDLYYSWQYLEVWAREEGAEVSVGDSLVSTSAFDVRFVPGTTVAPSEQVEFDMYFTPRSGKDATNPSEPFWALLRLSASGTRSDESSAAVTLKGIGEAGSCLLPKEIDFGPVPVGETFTMRHTFANPTGIAAKAFIGEPTGGDAASFGVQPGEPKGEVTILPGSTVDAVYTFSFSCGDPGGRWLVELQVEDLKGHLSNTLRGEVSLASAN